MNCKPAPDEVSWIFMSKALVC